jgi:tetratricopeptide (TPR) repeat protein
MGGGAFLMRLLARPTIPVGSFLQAAVFCIVCVLSPNPLSLDGAETDEAPVLVHFRAAQQAIQRGDINRAVSEYKTVLRLDPTLVEARINLGLAYHMLGEYERGVSELAQGLRERPKVLGANVVLGIDYLKLGRPQKAIAPLKEALAIDHSNREARRALATAYLAENDYQHAGEEFQRAFSLETDKEEAWFGLGQDYLNMSNQLTIRVASEYQDTAWMHLLAGNFLEQRHLWNDAARHYRKALVLQPMQPGLHSSLGHALLHGTDLDGAGDEFRSELRLDANSIDALLGFATIYMSKGDAVGALQCISRVLEVSPQFLGQPVDFPPVDIPSGVLDKLLPVLQASSSRPAASFLLWAAYRALGETTQAEDQRKSFLSQTAALGGHRRGTPESKPVQVACKSHDYAACIRWLHARKNLTPADRLNLGKSLFALGQFEKAADAFAAVMAGEPQNAEAAYWLTHAFTVLSDGCFVQLVTNFPDSWRTRQLRAETYHLQQADKDAIEEYKAAVRLRPEDFELHRALGELYLASHALEEAKKELESALTLNPGDARGTYLLGSWYVDQRQPQAAIPYLVRSLRLDPSLLDARAVLGKAYLRTGQAGLAAPELEKAIEMDRYGDLHYLLYQAYRDLGKKNLAQKALAQSQELRKKSAADDRARIKQAEEE